MLICLSGFNLKNGRTALWCEDQTQNLIINSSDLATRFLSCPFRFYNQNIYMGIKSGMKANLHVIKDLAVNPIYAVWGLLWIK